MPEVVMDSFQIAVISLLVQTHILGYFLYQRAQNLFIS